MSVDRPTRGAAAWRRFVERVRREPTIEFAEHRAAFDDAFGGGAPAGTPAAVWEPGPAERRGSNLARLLARRGLADVAAAQTWAAADRGAFWSVALDELAIEFRRAPRAVLGDPANPLAPRWLDGAALDIVDSCLRGPDDAPAIVHAGERDPRPRTISRGELRRRVARAAAGLRRRGIDEGGRVALYMPMNVDCVTAYLATLRLGAAVVSIADSFPVEALRARLAAGGAEHVITVGSYLRDGKTLDLYDVVRRADAPPAIVAGPPLGVGLRPGDAAWDSALAGADGVDGSAGGPAGRTINVLFSSGTTGTPKAIPWTQATPIKCAADARYHQDVRPGDVVAWPTNVGWMMGPWLIFATLINGAAMALWEGSPGGSGFTGFVEDAGVTVLGVVPSLVRAWRAAGAVPRPWSHVRVFSSTGEPSAVEDVLWLMSRSGYRAPVVEYCGGTEIGGGYVTGTVLQPCSPATFTTPALGLDFVLLDESGRPVGEGDEGEVFIVPPSIGLSERLIGRDHDAAYHDGCPAGPSGEPLRRHGDRMSRLPGGLFRAQGRADDTMNLGGIKIGSLEIERVLAGHPQVVECAAVGVRPGGAGAERLVVYAVPRGRVDPAGLHSELGRELARRLNPLFRIEDLRLVERLPRTASNKLLRRELQRRWREERDGTGDQV